MDETMRELVMEAASAEVFGVWFLIGAALVFWMQAAHICRYFLIGSTDIPSTPSPNRRFLRLSASLLLAKGPRSNLFCAGSVPDPGA